MKSNLFSRYDLTDEDNKSFVEDIDKTLSIGREGLKHLIERYPNILSKTLKHERVKECENLSKELHVDFSAVWTAINVLGFFTSRLIEEEYKDDSAEQLTEDVFSLNLINEEKKDTFLEVIEILKEDLGNTLIKASAERISKLGVLPSFSGINTSVELRSIIERNIRFDESVDEYSPNLIGYIPIISISISSDDENNSNYYFQATIEETIIIIKNLQAALKISETMRAS
jgi:hypothetical protein